MNTLRLASQSIARRRSSGFTLLELLVVMVIIGVLATLVSLAVSGRAVDDRMQAESRRLEELLRLASDEAQAKGLELGFRQTTEGFEFLTPDTDSPRWIVVAEGMFRPRQIAEPFYLELRVDGRLLRPAVSVAPGPTKNEEEESESSKNRNSRASDKNDDSTRVEPQLLILSSGEMTAFTLDLKLKDHPQFYRVEGSELGQLSSGRQEERS